MTAVQLADMMFTQSCSQQIYWHISVVVNDGKACAALTLRSKFQYQRNGIYNSTGSITVKYFTAVPIFFISFSRPSSVFIGSLASTDSKAQVPTNLHTENVPRVIFN